MSHLEALGFGAVWVGESFRREIFANASLLLASSNSMVVGSGIANIWARDAQAMKAGQLTLDEAYEGRFLLGLGVSHVPLVNPRGHAYDRPYSAMRAYLDAMDAAKYDAPMPAHRPLRVLAALGPRMLELAAEKADGAHPYFVPVEHTAQARVALGRGKLLCPEQAVVLELDPHEARATARHHTRSYIRLPNYRNNLERLGFGSEDFQGGGSDRLVDAVVAWGDVGRVVGRVLEHLQAGADHVAIQVISRDLAQVPETEWATIAAKLGLGNAPERSLPQESLSDESRHP
jgi:probable F420-dependent oxidoreductase